jgi:Domain of unknown function (DUF4939)
MAPVTEKQVKELLIKDKDQLTQIITSDDTREFIQLVLNILYNVSTNQGKSYAELVQANQQIKTTTHQLENALEHGIQLQDSLAKEKAKNSQLQAKIIAQLKNALQTLNNQNQQPSRSAKVPDPEKFNGNREEFEYFALRIDMKMIGNPDHFPDEQSKIAYLINNLEEEPIGHLLRHVNKEGQCILESLSRAMEILRAAYGDPNKKRTAR